MLRPCREKKFPASDPAHSLICHQLTADGVDEGLVLLYQPVKFQCIQWLLSASFLPGISSALSIYTNQRGQKLQIMGKTLKMW